MAIVSGISYSALIPLAPWESPSFVKQSLLSLCAQTFPPSTVVVSCDGRPPAALLAVLASMPIEIDLVLGPGSEGVGPVLARGLERCPTEFVVRLDADDISVPRRCEHQIRTMLTQPELAAISTVVAEFHVDPGCPHSFRSVPLTSTAIRRCSRWRNPMNHPAVLLRRSAVLAVGNYRHCPAFEDYDLWLRLLRAGCLLQNDAEPLVFCRTGLSHLARRHGLHYAAAEVLFLWRCAREKLIPWPWVLLSIPCRLPLRFLPTWCLSAVMGAFLRCPVLPR